MRIGQFFPLQTRKFFRSCLPLGIRYRSRISTWFSPCTVFLEHCAGARWRGEGGQTKLKGAEFCLVSAYAVPDLCLAVYAHGLTYPDDNIVSRYYYLLFTNEETFSEWINLHKLTQPVSDRSVI